MIDTGLLQAAVENPESQTATYINPSDTATTTITYHNPKGNDGATS